MSYYKRPYYSTPLIDSTKKSFQNSIDHSKENQFNPYKIASEYLKSDETDAGTDEETDAGNDDETDFGHSTNEECLSEFSNDSEFEDCKGDESEFSETIEPRNHKEWKLYKSRTLSKNPMIFLIFTLMLFTLIWIGFILLHKSSRPEGLKHILNRFDIYLEKYQDWFDGVLERAKNVSIKIENKNNTTNNSCANTSNSDANHYNLDANKNKISLNYNTKNSKSESEPVPEHCGALTPKTIEIFDQNLSTADEELKAKDQRFKVKLEELKKKFEAKKEMKQTKTKFNDLNDRKVVAKFWKERIESTAKVVKDLKLEKINKKKKLADIKLKRGKLYDENNDINIAEIDDSEDVNVNDEYSVSDIIDGNGILKRLNMKIKREIDSFRIMKITDRIRNVDAVMKEIYDWLFKEAICESLLSDLVERMEIVKAAKETVEKTKLGKEISSQYASSGILKLDKIWKEISGLNASATLLDKLLLEPIFGEKVSNFDYNKRNKDQTYQRFLNFRNRPIKFERKVFDHEVNFKNYRSEVEELIVNQYQQIEREIFKLTLIDSDFYAQLSDVMVQVEGMRSFLGEFDDLWTRTSELNTNSLLARLDVHLNYQIKRKHLMKPQHSTEDVEMVLLETWHKRNLMELLTADRLVNYDELREFEYLKSVEYGRKFDYWLHRVLIKAPISKQTLAGMVFDWWIGGNQEYRFSLKRAMIDYEAVIEGDCYKKGQRPGPVLVQDCLNKDLGFTKIVQVDSATPDSIIFSAMHFFSNIARLDPVDKEEIRYLWPTSLVEKPSPVTEAICASMNGLGEFSKILDDKTSEAIDVIGTAVQNILVT